MSSDAGSLTSEVVSLIESRDVVGLATHRHYPHERMIYSRFGRCGFAIDVVRMEGGVRKLYSILVEARADAGSGLVRSFAELPGEVTYTIARISPEGVESSVKTARYRNAEELFQAVETVRQAFYRKYRELKAAEEKAAEPTRIGEEVFHQAGLSWDELNLGV
ncbi:MAG: hypothetical protein NXY59_03045 [Aigarchaeota archaeon]|nr:hypothetical protein [Candidatus Pelearchaeum maunauluense]